MAPPAAINHAVLAPPPMHKRRPPSPPPPGSPPDSPSASLERPPVPPKPSYASGPPPRDMPVDENEVNESHGASHSEVNRWPDEDVASPDKSPDRGKKGVKWAAVKGLRSSLFGSPKSRAKQVLDREGSESIMSPDSADLRRVQEAVRAAEAGAKDNRKGSGGAAEMQAMMGEVRESLLVARSIEEIMSPLAAPRAVSLTATPQGITCDLGRDGAPKYGRKSLGAAFFNAAADADDTEASLASPMSGEASEMCAVPTISRGTSRGDDQEGGDQEGGDQESGDQEGGDQEGGDQDGGDQEGSDRAPLRVTVSQSSSHSPASFDASLGEGTTGADRVAMHHPAEATSPAQANEEAAAETRRLKKLAAQRATLEFQRRDEALAAVVARQLAADAASLGLAAEEVASATEARLKFMRIEAEAKAAAALRAKQKGSGNSERTSPNSASQRNPAFGPLYFGPPVVADASTVVSSSFVASPETATSATFRPAPRRDRKPRSVPSSPEDKVEEGKVEGKVDYLFLAVTPASSQEEGEAEVAGARDFAQAAVVAVAAWPNHEERNTDALVAAPAAADAVTAVTTKVDDEAAVAMEELEAAARGNTFAAATKDIEEAAAASAEAAAASKAKAQAKAKAAAEQAEAAKAERLAASMKAKAEWQARDAATALAVASAEACAAGNAKAERQAREAAAASRETVVGLSDSMRVPEAVGANRLQAGGVKWLWALLPVVLLLLGGMMTPQPLSNQTDASPLRVSGPAHQPLATGSSLPFVLLGGPSLLTSLGPTAEPTAEQVAAKVLGQRSGATRLGLDRHPLFGSVAVVTGCDGGAGLEAASVLAGVAGMRVVCAGSDSSRLRDAAAAVRDRFPSLPFEVETLPLDLSSLSSVRAFAKAFEKKFPAPRKGLARGRLFARAGVNLAALVNSAPPAPEAGSRKADTGAANYDKGSFLLTVLLLPRLARGAAVGFGSRVVTVVVDVPTGGSGSESAASLLVTGAFATRLGASPVVVLSAVAGSPQAQVFGVLSPAIPPGALVQIDTATSTPQVFSSAKAQRAWEGLVATAKVSRRQLRAAGVHAIRKETPTNPRALRDIFP